MFLSSGLLCLVLSLGLGPAWAQAPSRASILAQETKKQRKLVEIKERSSKLKQDECVAPSSIRKRFGIEPYTFEEWVNLSQKNLDELIHFIGKKPRLLAEAEHMRFWVQDPDLCVNEINIPKSHLERVIDGFEDRFKDHFDDWSSFLAFVEQNAEILAKSVVGINMIGLVLGSSSLPLFVAGFLGIWLGKNAWYFKEYAKRDQWESIGAMLADDLAAIVTLLGGTYGLSKIRTSGLRPQLREGGRPTEDFNVQGKGISLETLRRLAKDPDLPQIIEGPRTGGQIPGPKTKPRQEVISNRIATQSQVLPRLKTTEISKPINPKKPQHTNKRSSNFS